jgi:2-polyprenyl-3-methyl-5-hydroxy-6-metoxy-1,4-benzoquinol methylase
MKEQILEPMLRRMRLRHVLPYLQHYRNCKLLDIGCGWEGKLLKTVEPYISYGVGLDYKAPEIKSDKLEFKSINLSDKLPFDDNSFDFITMLAVMEHLENDEAILAECCRILRPAGGILITVPSWYAKPILEFLSYRLNIINPEEIRDHKRYYNKYDLIALVNKVKGLHVIKHSYFQWQFNNMIFIQRNTRPVKNANSEVGL